MVLQRAGVHEHPWNTGKSCRILIETDFETISFGQTQSRGILEEGIERCRGQVIEELSRLLHVLTENGILKLLLSLWWAAFGWDSCEKGQWYKKIESEVPKLEGKGFTHMWLPPPSQSVSNQVSLQHLFSYELLLHGMRGLIALQNLKQINALEAVHQIPSLTALHQKIISVLIWDCGEMSVQLKFGMNSYCSCRQKMHVRPISWGAYQCRTACQCQGCQECWLHSLAQWTVLWCAGQSGFMCLFFWSMRSQTGDWLQVGSADFQYEFKFEFTSNTRLLVGCITPQVPLLGCGLITLKEWPLKGYPWSGWPMYANHHWVAWMICWRNMWRNRALWLKLLAHTSDHHWAASIKLLVCHCISEVSGPHTKPSLDYPRGKSGATSRSYLGYINKVSGPTHQFFSDLYEWKLWFNTGRDTSLASCTTWAASMELLAQHITTIVGFTNESWGLSLAETPSGPMLQPEQQLWNFWPNTPLH